MSERNSYSHYNNIPEEAGAAYSSLSKYSFSRMMKRELIYNVNDKPYCVDYKANRNAEPKEHEHSFYRGRVARRHHWNYLISWLAKKTCHPSFKRTQDFFVSKELACKQAHYHAACTNAHKNRSELVPAANFNNFASH